MGLAIVGAILGALFGYLAGVDRQRSRPTVSPAEYAVAGALFGALSMPLVGALYGL